MSQIKIIGHRGACTDHPFYQKQKTTNGKPAENTIPAFQEAFNKGAKGIEFDVVSSKDHKLFVIHSNQLNDHIFSTKITDMFVSSLTANELKSLFVGRNQDGIIPTLEEVLDLVYKNSQCQIFNIELKGVMGTQDNYTLPNTHNSVAKLAYNCLSQHRSWHKKAIISSFSLQYLKDFRILETRGAAKYGMLFDEHPINKPPERLFPGSNNAETYMHLSVENIRRVVNEVGISHIHPEISTVKREIIELCASLNLGINTWSLYESPPTTDNDAAHKLAHVIKLCEYYKVPLGIITDHAFEVIQYINSLQPHSSVRSDMA